MRLHERDNHKSKQSTIQSPMNEKASPSAARTKSYSEPVRAPIEVPNKSSIHLSDQKHGSTTISSLIQRFRNQPALSPDERSKPPTESFWWKDNSAGEATESFGWKDSSKTEAENMEFEGSSNFENEGDEGIYEGYSLAVEDLNRKADEILARYGEGSNEQILKVGSLCDTWSSSDNSLSDTWGSMNHSISSFNDEDATELHGLNVLNDLENEGDPRTLHLYLHFQHDGHNIVSSSHSVSAEAAGGNSDDKPVQSSRIQTSPARYAQNEMKSLSIETAEKLTQSSGIQVSPSSYASHESKSMSNKVPVNVQNDEPVQSSRIQASPARCTQNEMKSLSIETSEKLTQSSGIEVSPSSYASHESKSLSNKVPVSVQNDKPAESSRIQTSPARYTQNEMKSLSIETAEKLTQSRGIQVSPSSYASHVSKSLSNKVPVSVQNDEPVQSSRIHTSPTRYTQNETKSLSIETAEKLTQSSGIQVSPSSYASHESKFLSNKVPVSVQNDEPVQSSRIQRSPSRYTQNETKSLSIETVEKLIQSSGIQVSPSSYVSHESKSLSNIVPVSVQNDEPVQCSRIQTSPTRYTQNETKSLSIETAEKLIQSSGIQVSPAIRCSQNETISISSGVLEKQAQSDIIQTSPTTSSRYTQSVTNTESKGTQSQYENKLDSITSMEEPTSSPSSTPHIWAIQKINDVEYSLHGLRSPLEFDSKESIDSEKPVIGEERSTPISLPAATPPIEYAGTRIGNDSQDDFIDFGTCPTSPIEYSSRNDSPDSFNFDQSSSIVSQFGCNDPFTNQQETLWNSIDVANHSTQKKISRFDDSVSQVDSKSPEAHTFIADDIIEDSFDFKLRLARRAPNDDAICVFLLNKLKHLQNQLNVLETEEKQLQLLL